MKDVLREAGKLKDAERTLNWYAITNEVYPKPTENGIDIDTFNTKLQGRIASILIMENSPEKACNTCALSHAGWITAVVRRRDWRGLSRRMALVSITAIIIPPMRWEVWTELRA